MLSIKTFQQYCFHLLHWSQNIKLQIVLQIFSLPSKIFLFDRHNHFLYQPLQVQNWLWRYANLSPSSIYQGYQNFRETAVKMPQESHEHLCNIVESTIEIFPRQQYPKAIISLHLTFFRLAPCLMLDY